MWLLHNYWIAKIEWEKNPKWKEGIFSTSIVLGPEISWIFETNYKSEIIAINQKESQLAPGIRRGRMSPGTLSPASDVKNYGIISGKI